MRSKSSSKGDHPSKDGGSTRAGGAKQKGTLKGDEAETDKFVLEEWWSTNPNTVTEWKIPNGKAFAGFYDFKTKLLTANSMGWPKIKLHHPRKKKRKDDTPLS